MFYLIDGYNLLHAVGWAPKRGSMSLERSRLRLIEWLAAELHGGVENICIIFDSRQDRGQTEMTHRGIYILFSRGETADDLIERFIRDERIPARLTVVSNDHRLQLAAQRRGCVSWTCEQYLDSLMRQTKDTPKETATSDEKPIVPSAGEMQEWLRAFEG